MPEHTYSTDPAWCARCKHLPCICPPLSAQTAKIQLQKGGRGGKVVTVVFNLDVKDEVLRDLLRTLQKACGTGGTVKDGQIEIQGDHRDTIEAKLKASGLKVKRAGG
ncbi:MAG TPA: translation initiation factor [Candidatus Xenobia bacterium]|jgi:translation initiation factor 1